MIPIPAAEDYNSLVGVCIGPMVSAPLVYQSSPGMVAVAIEERITKKQIKPTLNHKDKKEIGSVITQSIGPHGWCSLQRVQRWAKAVFSLEELKSSKWTSSRFLAQYEQLMCEMRPRFRFKGAIKAEPMPSTKPPRLLIADGDTGQLMSLVVIKCFEDLLFDWFEERSIKHLAKKEACERIAKRFSLKDSDIIEGDGSAWDTCCSAEIRACVENPIIKHITAILAMYGLVPNEWLTANIAAGEMPKLRLAVKNVAKRTTVVTTIDAIRRSGQRGTSCLNWWVNFTLWHTCVFGMKAGFFVNRTTKSSVDRWGEHRDWLTVFEGDDSGINTRAKTRLMAREAEVQEIWRRYGFNMKIIDATAKGRATIVGWEFEVTEHGMSGNMAPELVRTVTNAGLTTSPKARTGAQEGVSEDVSCVGASAYTARAVMCAMYPTLSEHFARIAEAHLRKMEGYPLMDREEQYQVFGDFNPAANRGLKDMIAHSRALCLSVSPAQELDLLRRLQHPTTLDELTVLQRLDGDHLLSMSVDEYRGVLPRAWRA